MSALPNSHPGEIILMADDDPDDCLLAEEALSESQQPGSFRWVKDGCELLDYLRGEGAFASPATAPRPSIILLDLNMPKKDGREALKEIRADPAFQTIPIIVLSTSKSATDIERVYQLGGTTFVTKPSSFEGMVDVMGTLSKYWFKTVQLPASAA